MMSASATRASAELRRAIAGISDSDPATPSLIRSFAIACGYSRPEASSVKAIRAVLERMADMHNTDKDAREAHGASRTTFKLWKSIVRTVAVDDLDSTDLSAVAAMLTSPPPSMPPSAPASSMGYGGSQTFGASQTTAGITSRPTHGIIILSKPQRESKLGIRLIGDHARPVVDCVHAGSIAAAVAAQSDANSSLLCKGAFLVRVNGVVVIDYSHGTKMLRKAVNAVALELSLEQIREEDLGFRRSVETTELLRLQRTLNCTNGRLSVSLNRSHPNMPSDMQWCCAPSEYRLHVVECSMNHTDGLHGLDWLNATDDDGDDGADRERDRERDSKNGAQALHHALQSNARTQQTPRGDAPGDRVRCVSWFKCTNAICSRHFKKNTLWLEQVHVDGAVSYIDPRTAEVPYEQCGTCYAKCNVVEGEYDHPSIDVRVYGIEPFNCFESKHHALKDHEPDTCPECIKHGSWCDSSRVLSKKTPNDYDKAILRHLASPPQWQPSPWGLEIYIEGSSLCSEELELCKTRQYRVTLIPIHFLFPTGKQKLIVEMSFKAGLLLRHNPPAHIKSFSDVLTALNFVSRETVCGRDEGTRASASLTCVHALLTPKYPQLLFPGAWYNRLVDVFLAPDNSCVPEFEGGFLRFPFSYGSDSHGDDSNGDWLTAYHGTSRQNAGKIFFDGQLRRPLEGAQIAHGQSGSHSRQTIYVSPAKEKAAFPTYSNLFELMPHRKAPSPEDQRADPPRLGELVTDKNAQIIFEVKVKPGSYSVQPSTLGNGRHWPKALRIDPRFETHSDLEWLIESSSDLFLSAILVRQFGDGSDAFGTLNTRVSKEYKHATDELRQGAQYHWTSLRETQARELGHTTPRFTLPTGYFRDTFGRVVASLAASWSPSTSNSGGHLLAGVPLASSISSAEPHLQQLIFESNGLRAIISITEGCIGSPDAVGSALASQCPLFVDAVVKRNSEQRYPVPESASTSGKARRKRKKPMRSSHTRSTAGASSTSTADASSSTPPPPYAQSSSAPTPLLPTSPPIANTSIGPTAPDTAATSATTPSLSNPVPDLAAERVFLGVEHANVEAVLRGGYCVQRRKYVAASNTIEEAQEGCQKWHADSTGRCAVFEVLSSQQISKFYTPSGSVRLTCAHVPVSLLRRVV